MTLALAQVRHSFNQSGSELLPSGLHSEHLFVSRGCSFWDFQFCFSRQQTGGRIARRESLSLCVSVSAGVAFGRCTAQQISASDANCTRESDTLSRESRSETSRQTQSNSHQLGRKAEPNKLQSPSGCLFGLGSIDAGLIAQTHKTITSLLPQVEVPKSVAPLVRERARDGS